MNYLLDDIYVDTVRDVDYMHSFHSMTQRVSVTLQQSAYVAASVALMIATTSVVYGVTNNDLLTALGAVLFVPSIVLLFGIGKQSHDAEFSSTQQQTN